MSTYLAHRHFYVRSHLLATHGPPVQRSIYGAFSRQKEF